MIKQQLLSVADLSVFLFRDEAMCLFFLSLFLEKGGGGYLQTKRLIKKGGMRLEQLKYGQTLAGSCI